MGQKGAFVDHAADAPSLTLTRITGEGKTWESRALPPAFAVAEDADDEEEEVEEVEVEGQCAADLGPTDEPTAGLFVRNLSH